MRGMHERFQRKQLKWQRYASSYSKWAFGINFIILVMQIIQMLYHQLVEVFGAEDSNSAPVSYKFCCRKVDLNHKVVASLDKILHDNYLCLVESEKQQTKQVRSKT